MTMWSLGLVLTAVLGYALEANGIQEQKVICPKGDWVNIHRACYLFVTKKQSWNVANKYCQDKSGSLIIIQSTKEKKGVSEYLKTNFRGTDNWYGGFKKDKKGAWKTIENMDLRQVEVQWKRPDFKTRPRYDCGILHKDDTTLVYLSSKCRSKKPFICEFHPITPSPSTEATTLLVTPEAITSPSKTTPHFTYPTTKQSKESVQTQPLPDRTHYPAGGSTNLTESDAPIVFSVTGESSSTHAPVKPAPTTRSASFTTTTDDDDNDDDDDDDDDDDEDEDEDDDDVTHRVSRSTNGFGISQLPTQSPDGTDVDDGDASEATSISEMGGNSPSTDWENPTKPEIPVTYTPVDDTEDPGSSEDEDENKETVFGLKDGVSRGRGNGHRVRPTGAVGRGERRSSSPSTIWTTKTTGKSRRVKPTTPMFRHDRYDWEEVLEEFEGCYIPGGRGNALAQVLSARRLYQQDDDQCPTLRVSGMVFSRSDRGATATSQCRNGVGVATFTCDGDDRACWQGQPDVTGCASPRFKALWRKVKIDLDGDEDEDESGGGRGGVDKKNATIAPQPTAEEAVNVTSELVKVTETEDVSIEDIIVTTKVIAAVTRRTRKRLVKRNKEQIAKIVDNVVKAGSNLVSKKKKTMWKKMTREEKVRSASTLMVAMETATLSMAKEIEEPTVINQADENIEMKIQVVSVEEFEREKKDLVYDSSQSENTFSIPMKTLKGVTKGRLAKAVFMTHYSMADLLGSSKKSSDQTSEDESQTADEKTDDSVPTDAKTETEVKKGDEEEEEEEEGPQLASYILSASLGFDMPLTKLPEPITFSMKHTVEIKTGYKVMCSFWNVSQSNRIGFWSQDGCQIKETDAFHTTCQCDHMTNFAILLDVHGLEISTMHQSALRLVTIIGCIISCMSLMAAWLTFQCFTSLQGERTTIHKNLAVCLFVAEILFVAGVDNAKHELACSVIAVFLHFFFLAAFTWMFLEGFHIIIMLVQIFDASRSRLPYYYLIGYGVPFIVVGISCLVYFPGYGTERFCWLSTDRAFIWAFAGPVALILVVNAIFLTYALATVWRHADYVFNPKDRTNGSGIRQWIMGALALEVLLGLTWMFGYAMLNEAGLTLAYIFTILNSLQGLFIFVFHCLLNKKTQKEYRRVLSIPLSRSSSSAGTQSTLTKRNNATSRSNSLKQSFKSGTSHPKTGGGIAGANDVPV